MRARRTPWAAGVGAISAGELGRLGGERGGGRRTLAQYASEGRSAVELRRQQRRRDGGLAGELGARRRERPRRDAGADETRSGSSSPPRRGGQRAAHTRRTAHQPAGRGASVRCSWARARRPRRSGHTRPRPTARGRAVRGPRAGGSGSRGATRGGRCETGLASVRPTAASMHAVAAPCWSATRAHSRCRRSAADRRIGTSPMASLGPQQLTEQPVVAEPPRPRFDRYHEPDRVGEARERLGPVRITGQGLRETAADAVDGGGLEQERPGASLEAMIGRSGRRRRRRLRDDAPRSGSSCRLSAAILRPAAQPRRVRAGSRRTGRREPGHAPRTAVPLPPR